MTPEEKLKICLLCENRKMDMQKGTVCKYTGEKPEFDDKCDNFVTDARETYNQLQQEEENKPLEVKPGSLLLSIAVGLISALVCAAIWTGVAVATEKQFAIIAILVGLAVGFCVKLVAKGSLELHGIIACIFTLIACILGDFFTALSFVAAQEGVPFMEALRYFNYSYAIDLWLEIVDIMTVVFYLIAIYEAYKIVTKR